MARKPQRAAFGDTTYKYPWGSDDSLQRHCNVGTPGPRPVPGNRMCSAECGGGCTCAPLGRSEDLGAAEAGIWTILDTEEDGTIFLEPVRQGVLRAPGAEGEECAERTPPAPSAPRPGRAGR